MKNKFVFLCLILTFALAVSCKHDTGSDTPKEEVVVISGTAKSMALMQKTKYVFNGTNKAYYDKIINYGDSYDYPVSYEIFDYSGFNLTSQTGTFKSTVSSDEAGKNISESSTVTIEYVEAAGGNPAYYARTAEFFKYTNGAKEAKAYMVEYSTAEDKDFNRPTKNMVYSPKDDSITSLLQYGYKNGLPLYEFDFYTSGLRGDKTGITGKIKYKTMKIYNNDETKSRCDNVVILTFEEDTTANPDIHCSYECYDYDDDVYKNYFLKRTYSAVMKNGYATLFNADGTYNESALPDDDDFSELPSSYEGVKYKEYGSKEYPVVYSKMNEEWEIETQIKKSYAKRPDSDDYYECESRTYSKKEGQGEDAIVLQEYTRTKNYYSVDSDGVLTLVETLLAEKSKYGSSVAEKTETGTTDFNN